MLSIKKIIIFSIAAFLLLIIAGVAVYFLIFSKGDKKPVQIIETKTKNIELEIWGLFDDISIYSPIINEYQKVHPEVSVSYKKAIFDDYETNLINAIASGKGPDIFYFNNNWVYKHRDKISPIKAQNVPSDRFIQSTIGDFIQKGLVYGVPLNVDNLALFYNKDLFALQGLSNPPRTWDQFTDYAQVLTKFSSDGNIIRSGASMGTFDNINRAADILLTLMMQNRVNVFDITTGKVAINKTILSKDGEVNPSEDALRFYTDFANSEKKIYTWNDGFNYSIDAFTSGEVAMMFNYAYNISLIEERAPYLNFGISQVPSQYKNSPITHSNYWALSVSRNSLNPETAWDFINFLTAEENYLKYFEKARVIPAQQKFINIKKTDQLLRPFIDQLIYSKTPYILDQSKVERILKQTINAVTSGALTAKKALEQAEDRLDLIIR